MDLYLRPTNAQDTSDDPPNDTNDNVRPLIPLRLPAALLASLSNESRLVIRHTKPDDGQGGDVGGGRENRSTVEPLSLTVVRRGARGQPDDIYPLEEAAVDREQTTEWYRATTASDRRTATARKELYRIGTTRKRYAIKPKTTTDLKEIGKRTRKLFEEERRKRKEIVRLDDDELPPQKKKAVARKRKSPPPAEEVGKSPPKKTGGKGTSAVAAAARKRKRRVASDVDGWMPNVDGLLLLNSPAKEDRSNIVRLHGLPVGAKPEHVRKFFHGLDPSLIFALPSFDDRIRGWDATCDASACKRDGRPVVERHASDVRVFVKFKSAPVADAAIGRSGESIGFATAEGAAAPFRGKKKIAGATISLTPVPKQVASFLLKHVAIHARKGEYINDTIAKVERKLGTVTHMIWIMATKKLNLPQQINRRGNRDRLAYLGRDYAFPTNRTGFIKLTKVYNRMIDEHERLESDSGLMYTHAFDPSCMEDSAHRITQSVSNWLLDEIDVIGDMLKESQQIIKW